MYYFFFIKPVLPLIKTPEKVLNVTENDNSNMRNMNFVTTGGNCILMDILASNWLESILVRILPCFILMFN